MIDPSKPNIWTTECELCFGAIDVPVTSAEELRFEETLTGEAEKAYWAEYDKRINAQLSNPRGEACDVTPHDHVSLFCPGCLSIHNAARHSD